MSKMLRRTVCVLLMLTTLIVMLPMAAFAAKDLPIQLTANPEITGITEPVGGEKPDMDATIKPNGYEIVNVRWFDEDDNAVTKNTAFIAGETYTCRVAFEAADGYVLPALKDLSAKIDGAKAYVGKKNATTYFAYMDYIAEEALISSVAVIDLDAPLNGEKPDTAVTVKTGACSADVQWFLKGSSTPLGANDTFVTNKKYIASITLTPNKGSEFDTVKNLKATINGDTAKVSAGKTAAQRVIEKEFTAVPNIISKVELTKVTEPVQGNKPDKTSIIAPECCTVVSAFWMDAQTKAPLESNDTFVAGKKYTFVANVKPGTGNSFTDLNKFAATVNGNAASVSAVSGTPEARRIECTFTAANIRITEVAVTEVVAPVEGKTPVTALKVAPATCELGQVQWIDQATSKAMGATETFAKDKKYRLTVILAPKAGYEFASGKDLVITVNGVAVNATSVTNLASDPTKRLVSLEYTAAGEDIKSIAVTEAVLPLAGATPVLTVKLPENCALLKSAWYDAKTGDILPANATFVFGNAYKLVVTTQPKDSLAFAPKDVLKATINGNAATIEAVEGNTAARNVSYTFVATSNITVTYDANGGTGAPAAQAKEQGKALTLSSTIPTRDGYTFNCWNDKADGTGLAYTAGSSYTGDKSIVLYAQWKANLTPPAPAKVNRIEGSDRVITAVKISAASFTSAKSVIVTSGENYADALAAAPLAYGINSPILLSYGDKIADELKAELTRLKPTNIYIIGGKNAVPEAVETQLKSYGKVARIAGKDRFETSVHIAMNLKALCGTPTEIFVAYAANYPDSLAISPVAAMLKCPILYADKSGKLDATVESFIKSSGCPRATILGGTSNIPDSVKTALSAAGITSVGRIGGTDRFDTMLLINNAYASKFTGKGVCLATGLNFPDALAGSVFAAKNAMPIVLVPATVKSGDSIDKYVSAKKPEVINVFGGKNAVSDAVVTELGN